MKVAFATRDNVHVNAHFGWAKQMDFYDVSKEGHNFLETVSFGGNLKEDGNEDKLVPKVEAVLGCTLVYVSDIGGSAAARLIQKNITPMKAQNSEDKIADVLDQLVEKLNGDPPPWLRKVLQQESKKRFDDFDDFDEDEEE